MSEPNNSEPQSGVVNHVRRYQKRRREGRKQGEPSLASQLGQIGVLGWIIITPTLIGLFVGRWLDHTFQSGVFFSAALLFLGVALGFWSGWRWMHRP